MKKKKYGSVISNFIRQIESIRETYPIHIQQISDRLKKSIDELEKLLKEKSIITEEDVTKYIISIEEFDVFQKHLHAIHLQKNAYQTFTQGAIISIVSIFDSYMGDMIRLYFDSKPDALNSTEKNISLSKILEFGNIEDAKEYIIEKEVEGVLRDSHDDQFKWLENRLKITLHKDLPIWNDFIELTERRNVFAHNNGEVSESYIQNCKSHLVELPTDTKIGKLLKVTPQYFQHSCDIIYEIGVKLGHVLWRKLLPSEIDSADTNLINDITYELLKSSQYDLAIKISEFGCQMLKKHAKEESRRIIIINSAIAYKNKGYKVKVEEILSKEDWSGWKDEFQLALLVLRDKYEEAAQLMKKIGLSNERLTKTAYLDWPLFDEFRNTSEFQKIFNELFTPPSIDIVNDIEDKI